MSNVLHIDVQADNYINHLNEPDISEKIIKKEYRDDISDNTILDNDLSSDDEQSKEKEKKTKDVDVEKLVIDVKLDIHEELEGSKVSVYVIGVIFFCYWDLLYL